MKSSDIMVYILGIKEQIEIWDEKLDSIASRFDSPWTGMIVFIVLLAISILAINAYSSKK